MVIHITNNNNNKSGMIRQSMGSYWKCRGFKIGKGNVVDAGKNGRMGWWYYYYSCNRDYSHRSRRIIGYHNG